MCNDDDDGISGINHRVLGEFVVVLVNEGNCLFLFVMDDFDGNIDR